jgi:hypothetical protein
LTGLSPPSVWVPVVTNTAGANGLWTFTATNPSGFQAQFFRIAAP